MGHDECPRSSAALATSARVVSLLRAKGTCTARACTLLRTRGTLPVPLNSPALPYPFLSSPPTNPKGQRPHAAWDTPSFVVPLLRHPCQVGCPGLPKLHCSQQSHAPRPGTLRKKAAKESRNFTRSSKDVRVRRNQPPEVCRAIHLPNTALHVSAAVAQNRSASNNVKKEKVQKEREGEVRGDNVDTVQVLNVR